MHIDTIPINYHDPYLSGCSEKLFNFIDGTNRLYARGNQLGLERLSVISVFPFIWSRPAGITLLEFPAVCPVQLLTVNQELDYGSFNSLN